MSAWFAGPKAENGDWFESVIQRIIEDYYYWRRNYFPEDAVVVDSKARRDNEVFQDRFDDRLLELLARLKGDVPFSSPRYAGHMIAEQALPAIAGLFAALLYNPNNVSSESAPVTVRLELEASQMIARMLGYGDESWAHLCSGGTVANFEAIWMARTVRYLPFVIDDMRHALGMPLDFEQLFVSEKLGLSPIAALEAFAKLFAEWDGSMGKAIRAYLDSPMNVVERGVGPVCAALGSSPVVLAPESHHYCFGKAMDLLGLGRENLWTVKVDANFRMDVRALESRLEQASAEGKHVIAVVAVVGTTEEGAIDPVEEILDLRSSREAEGKASFWLHADAAYGGYFRTMTSPNRIGLGEPKSTVKVASVEREIALNLPVTSACDSLERLGECDSITIDPHKLGYIPYPAGAVCFRSNMVKPIARQEAPYLEESGDGFEAERFSDRIGVYILEGSKPGSAAAAVWLSHSLIPLDGSGHGALVQQTVRNAAELHALLEGYPAWSGEQDIVAVPLCVPGSNIVCYAFRPSKAATLKEINALNKGLYERFSITAEDTRRVYGQSFFVSRTTLSPKQYATETVSEFLGRLGVSAEEYERQGVYLIRSVLMNPWYQAAKERGRFYLSELVEELFSTAKEMLSSG